MEAIPAPNALPGGTVWEPKLDGYRGVIVRAEQARIWSRNGRDLTDRFPDIARAAEQQLPERAVVDGELVIYVDAGCRSTRSSAASSPHATRLASWSRRRRLRTSRSTCSHWPASTCARKAGPAGAGASSRSPPGLRRAAVPGHRRPRGGSRVVRGADCDRGRGPGRQGKAAATRPAAAGG
ncbi:MAG: hypothetical protein ACRDP9_31760 [Kribbellaceae bacterium]